MRKILFIGKTHKGEWVVGDLIHRKIWSTDVFIIRVEDNGFDSYIEYEVIPETIGQYTNINDKNGKKIFEGYIVKFGDIVGVVNYNCGCFCIKINKPDWRNRNNPAIDIVLNEYPNDIEIIGNMHDNPELLKGGD